MLFRRSAWAVAAAVCLGVAPAWTADPTPAELAAALQRKYDGIKDFTADFVQVYRGGALRRELTPERGRMMVKKPGMMRWVYNAPEQKEFVSDGVKLYTYSPQDKLVTITSVPAADQASTPAFFLAGKGNLVRDFTPSAAEAPATMPLGTRGVKLVPKVPQPEYESLVLLVDPATLALRGLMTTDAQGGTSTFTFANLKENVGLTDKTFAFTPPRGVEIVTESSRR